MLKGVRYWGHLSVNIDIKIQICLMVKALGHISVNFSAQFKIIYNLPNTAW